MIRPVTSRGETPSALADEVTDAGRTEQAAHAHDLEAVARQGFLDQERQQIDRLDDVDHHRAGREAADVLGDRAHGRGIVPVKVLAPFTRLAHAAGGDDHDVAAGDVVDPDAAADRGDVAAHRARLHQVERFAGGDPVLDVHQQDVGGAPSPR